MKTGMSVLAMCVGFLTACSTEKDDEQSQKVEIVVRGDKADPDMTTTTPTLKVTRQQVEAVVDAYYIVVNKFLDLTDRSFIDPQAPVCLAANDILAVLSTFRREVQDLPVNRFQAMSGTITQRYNDFVWFFNASPYSNDQVFVNAALLIGKSNADLVAISGKFQQEQTASNTND